MADDSMTDDQVGESKMDLAERLAYLERRFEARDDVANRILREEVARAVQSVGIIVDYLAKKGLADRAELKAYIEERFLVMGAPTDEEPRRLAIDVYGWLMWAEMTEVSRIQARKALSVFGG